MKHVSVASDAKRDIGNGFRFYAKQSEPTARYFFDAVQAELASLAVWAGVHVKTPGGAHRMMVRRFPFAIYYRLLGDEVVVVAVLDCRSNPRRIARIIGGH